MKGRNNFSVVILAAGLSERMGVPKMFLKWNNNTFIESIVEGYIAFGCKEIVVVLNERDKMQFEMLSISKEGIKAVVNKHIENGRFYSLKLGMSALTQIEHCFVNNVDNPFIEPDILSAMSLLAKDDNFVVPVCLKRKGHPVLINKKIIDCILSEKDFDINIKEYLQKFECTLCKVDSEKIHININTKEDLQRIIENYERA